jgi:2-dehydro-3-deoxygluconokinase
LAEGVGCKYVIQSQGQVPGMYMIELDQHGERSFHYWRANSPAAKILDNPEQADAVFKALGSFATVFLSGISLAILKPSARAALIDFLSDYRARGGKVAFDCNHRPHLWVDPSEAIDCYKKMYQITDIALPTFDDEQMLFGYQTAEHALDAIQSEGVTEVVLKMGEKGCYYTHDGEHGFVPVEPAKVVDTTSAGDSFNAGYMNKRLAGASVEESCKAAHRLASIVVQHRGAIIPIEVMPSN